jgi:hypothetical protein
MSSPLSLSCLVVPCHALSCLVVLSQAFLLGESLARAKRSAPKVLCERESRAGLARLNFRQILGRNLIELAVERAERARQHLGVALHGDQLHHRLRRTYIGAL